MEKVSFEAGQRIFKEGDEGDVAYVIESGEVEISFRRDGKTIPISVVRKGDMIGEMALLDPGPRSATARCLTIRRQSASHEVSSRTGWDRPIRFCVA